MTGDIEKRICLRCKRPFTPTKAGQEYGEKCLRKMAGQTMLMDRYVVPPRKRRHKKAPSISPEQSAVDAYLGSGIV